MAMPESFKFDVRVRERLLAKGEITPNVSGRQEFLENLINEFI